MIYISSNNHRQPVTETFTPLYYSCRRFTFSHLNFTQLYFIPLHYTCRRFTFSHLNFTQLHFSPLPYSCRRFTFSHLNFTQLHFSPLRYTCHFIFIDLSMLVTFELRYCYESPCYTTICNLPFLTHPSFQ
jgi:DNA-directed RNA polymerase subunit N (RpoN/RPB10)